MQVAAILGTRQHEQYTTEVLNNVSGLGFVFWFFILSLYFIQGKAFLKVHSLSIGVLLLYLTTYFTLPVTGRIFESAVLIVLLSGTKIKGSLRYVFYSTVIIFSLGQWAMRLNADGLGFYP
jgi:hypothetical protein